VNVRMHEDDYGRAGGTLLHSDEIREDSPQRKLNGKVKDVVAGVREGPVTRTKEIDSLMGQPYTGRSSAADQGRSSRTARTAPPRKIRGGGAGRRGP
jgi:hypothetical protein